MNFNWKVYLEKYPDLHMITDEKGAYRHYIKYGKRENRTDFDFDFDFISGEKIQLKCDYFIATDQHINANPVITNEIKRNPHKWLKIENVVKEDFLLKIFCYTDILEKNELHILKNVLSDFVIYFHNSDSPFLMEHYTQLSMLPHCKKIYAQNNTVKEVSTLPIGQANRQWPHGNGNILQQTIDKKIKKTKSIYLQFSMTSPKRIVCKEKLNWIEWQGEYKYKEYLETLAQFEFCVCVEGNGLDTHRFWECVYLKVVPICEKNAWTDVVKEIYPMIIVDDWNDLRSTHLHQIDWEKYTPILDIENYFKI